MEYKDRVLDTLSREELIELLAVRILESKTHHGVLINLIHHAGFPELPAEPGILLDGQSAVVYKNS